MVQEIETEHLARCPFCGGKAKLRVADTFSSKDNLRVFAMCKDCHSTGRVFNTGKIMFGGGYVTTEEAKEKAVAQWNKRCEETKAREVYVNSLSVAEMAPILEAVKLYDYSDYSELRFCRNMARVYGCKPLEADGSNLDKFLITLYHYGKVQGIRQERARHKKKADREVMEIAQALMDNDPLYQVMKLAVDFKGDRELRFIRHFLNMRKVDKEKEENA